MRVRLCVSALGALEGPVFLLKFSCSNGISEARMRVGCRLVTLGIIDDVCCFSCVAGAGEWAEVDAWPLIHGGCYHVTEVGGPYDL